MITFHHNRRRLVSGTLPADEISRTSQQVAGLVDYGNNLLGLDLQIRDPITCKAANTINLSAVSAFEMVCLSMFIVKKLRK